MQFEKRSLNAQQGVSQPEIAKPLFTASSIIQSTRLTQNEVEVGQHSLSIATPALILLNTLF
jgi:hypothetical protein